MVWWKKDKEKEKETTTPSEFPSTFTEHLSSLDPVSDKFTRIDDKGGTDEETGQWIEGTMEEYVDKDAIIEHFFLGDKHTQTRTKGETEEGWNKQKWDKGLSQWVDVSSDYEETTTDPRMGRKDIRNITSWGEGGAFKDKWADWVDKALPNERFLGGSKEEVSNRMMIEHLKYSQNPDDIIIKEPVINKLQVTNVERPRDNQRTEKYPKGKHLAGKPVIYTFDDGSKWTHPSSTSFKKAEKKLKSGKMKPVAYYKALYNPRGEKIAGGDLRSTGWTQVKSINDKIIDSMKKDDEWNVMNQDYRAGE